MPPKKRNNTKKETDDEKSTKNKFKIQNFYLKKEVQAFKPKTHCPNLKHHGIDIGSKEEENLDYYSWKRGGLHPPTIQAKKNT